MLVATAAVTLAHQEPELLADRGGGGGDLDAGVRGSIACPTP